MRPRPFLALLIFFFFSLGTLFPSGAVRTLYSHGDPSNLEQWVLEMVNRARRDPLAEASRLGITFFDGNPYNAALDTAPKPPLAFNASLNQAARQHSSWQLATGRFGHTGENGSTPDLRMRAAGYDFGSGQQGWAENVGWHDLASGLTENDVAAKIHDALFTSRQGSTFTKHRRWILEPLLREVGLGLATGQTHFDGRSRTAMVLTECIAVSSASPTAADAGAFAVGAVYDDGNGNGVYDPGEGVEGVKITPSVGNYYTQTSRSGGFSLPLGSARGEVTLTFGGAFPAHVVTTQVSYRQNVKVDLRLQDLPAPAQGFAAWAADFGLSTDPWHDGDLDGRPAVEEYAFGTDPSVQDGAQPGLHVEPEAGGQGRVRFQFNGETPDLTVRVESSTDLMTWRVDAFRAAGESFVPVSNVSVTESVEGGTREVVLIFADPQVRYYRLALALSGEETVSD